MLPLLLDDEETVAVALGLQCAPSGAVEGIEEASMRARSKIEQMLPTRLARCVVALQAVIVTPPKASISIDARMLSTIAGACRDNETLRFSYRDHHGNASSRSVEPHRIVNTGRRWYLVGWNGGRKDWRTFRVDRIERRVTTGPGFIPRTPLRGTWRPTCPVAFGMLRRAAPASSCGSRPARLLTAFPTGPAWLNPSTRTVASSTSALPHSRASRCTRFC